MSETVRLIKKYPNRRLYDTKTSAYITLTDVKDLVLKFEVFKVVDAKTDEDLTRSILLQIILEEESGGVPLFSCELLSGFIRFYGSAMQGMLGKYLENNMKTFVDSSPSCRTSRVRSMVPATPAICRPISGRSF
jgi:polyhydroxyalkanoate synthesis repressor PhaR